MHDKHDSNFQNFDPPIHSFDKLLHEIHAVSQVTISGGTEENSRNYSRVLALAVEDLQKRTGICSRQTCEGLLAHGSIRFGRTRCEQTDYYRLPSLLTPNWNDFGRKEAPTFEQYNRVFHFN